MCAYKVEYGVSVVVAHCLNIIISNGCFKKIIEIVHTGERLNESILCCNEELQLCGELKMRKVKYFDWRIIDV